MIVGYHLVKACGGLDKVYWGVNGIWSIGFKIKLLVNHKF
jgi:hypothetical protein